MDPIISRLKSPEECETFERNARKLGKADLAVPS
jgi:hypothetical protein